jgi:hypothetical protein
MIHGDITEKSNLGSIMSNHYIAGNKLTDYGEEGMCSVLYSPFRTMTFLLPHQE